MEATISYLYFLFVNATKYINSKQKNFEIKDYALCVGNISKDFTINNVKITGLKESKFFFLLILILLKLMIFKIYLNIQWKKHDIKNVCVN